MRLSRVFSTAFLSCVASAAWPGIAIAQPPPEPPPPVGAAPEAPAPTPAPPPLDASPAKPEPKPDTTKIAGVEFTSLKVLLQKGIITQAEYDAAVRDLGETSGMKAGDGNTFVLGKWATTLYGFVEGDVIYDTTQSLNEIAGNSLIQKDTTFAGSHDRMQFTVRNTRLGLRVKAPEVNGIRGAGQLEMDFFGTQLPFTGAAPLGTEAATYNNPVMRIRHANLKVETPIVDFLIGQYWVLYGWQAQYLPATVEIQGIPGEIFSRQMQVRVSKTVKSKDVTFEAAIAALRPPARESAMPAGQGGIRFAVNNWTAPQTLNFAGTSIQPLSIAVTGDARRVRVPELSAEPKQTNSRYGTSLAVDTFIPVIPGAKETKGNSLALNGEFSTGYGTGDLYTGLTGGVANPALPNPAAANPAPAYDPKIDPGIAMYNRNGDLRMVQWTAFVAGLQYYLPGSGNLFVSANYSRVQSANSGDFGPAATVAGKTRQAEDFFDVNLFWDITPAVRLAGEYANFHDSYNDNSHATNERVQVSGAFLF